MSTIYLRKPNISDLEEIEKSYKKSQTLHHPWTYPPTDFQHYLQ